MTDYFLGKQLPPSLPGVPSFWKVGEADLVEHALSPQNDRPICGYEGEVKVTQDRWYESTSSKRCEVCLVRSGG